ncbi:MAG: hypothetical protein PVI21_02210 [Candidatus Woesebacteria bacterium]|jgi:hypothetical protein
MSDKKHIDVLSKIYAHPLVHNIKWIDLEPALRTLGVFRADKNGSHHFTRGGRTVVFEYENGDTLSADDIVKLRHFINISAGDDNEGDLQDDAVLAIDYQRAIIFFAPDLDGQNREVVKSKSPKTRILHAKPTAPPYSNAGPEVDQKYFDDIIKDIAKAKRVVILCHGSNTSNAAFRLMQIIRQKHSTLAHRVAAIKRCDLGAMSERQMLQSGVDLLRMTF